MTSLMHGSPPVTRLRPTEGRPSLERLRTDDAAWDAFVEASDTPFPLQLTAWADGQGGDRLDVGAGRRRRRLGSDRRPGAHPPPRTGAVRVRLRAARTGGDDASTAPASPRSPRPSGSVARAHRLVHVTADPGLEGPEPARLLTDAGWRPSDAVQPQTTQLIDLRPEEDALWSDVYKSTRRYVNGARKQGCTVREGTESDLPVFYGILVETARAERLHPPLARQLPRRLSRLRGPGTRPDPHRLAAGRHRRSRRR